MKTDKDIAKIKHWLYRQWKTWKQTKILPK